MVLLIDDSIVRGTTAKELIQMARDAGARKVMLTLRCSVRTTQTQHTLVLLSFLHLPLLQVYFASAAPPVRHCNVYGIDIPTRRELVAHRRTVDEVCATLGADRYCVIFARAPPSSFSVPYHSCFSAKFLLCIWHLLRVFYNSLEDICDAVRGLNPSVHNNTSSFECSCFDGHYVTPEVDAAYLQALEESRGSGRRGACAGGAPGQVVSEGVREGAQEFGEGVSVSTANTGMTNMCFISVSMTKMFLNATLLPSR